MKPFHYVVMPLIVLISCCLCGCDYTRSGGAYRLTFQDQSTRSSPVTVEAESKEQLHQVLERWLAKKGFHEFRYSAARAVWRKGGARVYVTSQSDNMVVIEISAMGYKRDLRLSEKTEIELLDYLEGQPGLAVAPITLVVPAVKKPF